MKQLSEQLCFRDAKIYIFVSVCLIWYALRSKYCILIQMRVCWAAL